MKHYLSIGILLIIILAACGNGDKTTKTSTSNTSSPKPVEKVTAAKNHSTNKSISSDAASGEQDAPMSKEQLAKAKELLSKVTDADILAVKASKLFKIHCAVCHGFKGNMMINGAKDLTKSKISIEEGVAQVYFGKGLMTPYKGVLKDAELVAVAQYVQKELRK